MSEITLEQAASSRHVANTRKKRSKSAFIVFISVWVLLIAGGLYFAKVYTEQIQRDITADVERQTAAQISEMQKAYDGRIAEMETTYQGEITQLKSKVDALNELLTFTKDNADTKTDNSNKLYTQLNEVKKQLDELKKSLDVLK